MKTCEALQDLLPLHATGDTGPEEALQVEDHLRACQSCTGDLEAYGRLAGEVRRHLGAVPPLPERAAAAGPALSARDQGSRWHQAAWMRLALAAALVMAGVLVGRLTVGPAAMSPGEAAGPRSAGAVVARQPPASAALTVFSPSLRPFLTQAARPAEGSRRTTSP